MFFTFFNTEKKSLLDYYSESLHGYILIQYLQNVISNNQKSLHNMYSYMCYVVRKQ